MGDISVQKTTAKIVTLSITVNGTLDTTSPMSVSMAGTDVTARVMTAEDGAASRRIKINAPGPVVGPGRALLTAQLLGVNVQGFTGYVVDVANPPPPTVVGSVVDVSAAVAMD